MSEWGTGVETRTLIEIELCKLEAEYKVLAQEVQTIDATLRRKIVDQQILGLKRLRSQAKIYEPFLITENERLFMLIGRKKFEWDFRSSKWQET